MSSTSVASLCASVWKCRGGVVCVSGGVRWGLLGSAMGGTKPEEEPKGRDEAGRMWNPRLSHVPFPLRTSEVRQ